MSEKVLALSPSSLNVFLACPRCFWADKNEKKPRVRGIFPSLPSGIDGILKTYYDNHRAAGTMPPEIEGRLPGMLFPDPVLMKKRRNWRGTDMTYTCPDTGAFLRGAIDEMLIDGDTHIIADYKTKGGPLKEADILGTYYQNQMDCYTLMGIGGGLKMAESAYLIYYYPLTSFDNGAIQFTVEPVELSVDPESARQTVRDAVACLAGEKPEAADKCEYCGRYGDAV